MLRLIILALAVCTVATGAAADTVTVSSTDVPKTFVDNTPAGFTTTLIGPNLVLTDLNLIFDDLRHTSVPDLRFELTSPAGTTSVIIKPFTEGGILSGLSTPDDFIGTVIDDQAATNLRDGSPPYTGSFNVNHAGSSILNPLAVFNGENAAGTWTLFASDRAIADVGRLNAWSIRFEGTAAAPEPTTLALLFAGIAGLACRRKRRR